MNTNPIADQNFQTVTTGTILDRIVLKKHERVRARLEHRSLKDLEKAAHESPPVEKDFTQALLANTLSIIAEVKRASPSKGLITEDYRPVDQAQAYARGGAAAVSVLTEQDFFLGSDRHLTDVRAAVPLPILRKDFIIDESQIYESRILGASAILLIAAILPDDILKRYIRIATGLGLSALLEVHTMDELLRAIDADAKLIGINNRDLNTFHVDLATTERLAPMIPAGRIVVSESGISSPSDVSRCYRSGVRAVLIGESLMRESSDPNRVEEKIRSMTEFIPVREAPGPADRKDDTK
ncbi:MAG: indole-3-glycerol phosphate synthase TrpC [Clostridiaceae bacterium]|nr:indole-3-glycerol phosphate synthase TrpC [Clostridiaceae bacterium]